MNTIKGMITEGRFENEMVEIDIGKYGHTTQIRINGENVSEQIIKVTIEITPEELSKVTMETRA